MQNGIYRIRNTTNQKCYIGSAATGLYKRWGEHQSLLRSGKHHSIALQRAWNKYGEDAFKFEILLCCDPENCIEYEQLTMDYYKPQYNMCPTAGSQLGYKHTDDAKAKMRQAHKGKILSQEHKLKISQALKNSNHIGQFQPGMTGAFKGRKHSEETKEKMSKAKQWRKNNDNIKFGN